jgi:hypothetical protein
MPKISALTLGTTIDGANDLIAFVDVSDTGGGSSPTGTTKKAVFNSIPTQNIYNTSSSLTAPRVVTMAGNLLEFREGTALMAIDAANFGVALGNNAVNASAILDISSTAKGILIPRMTTTERNAITVGASQDSLMIYNTTTNQYEYYEHATTSWTPLGGATLYSANGGLSSTRTVSQGANTLTFEANEGATGFRWRSQTNSKDYAIMNTTANGSGLIIEGNDDTTVGGRQQQAILQLDSTTSGVLIPRMTTIQRDLITVGASQTGLEIFNTTTAQFEFYNGASWVAVGGGGADGNGIYDGSGTVPTSTVATYTDTVQFTGGTSFRVDGQFFTNTAGTANYTNYLKGNGQTTYFLAESQAGANFLQLDEAGGGKFRASGSYTQYLGRAENAAYAFMFKNAAAKTNVYLWETSTGAEYINYLNTGRLGISVVPSAMLHVQASSGTDPLRVDTNTINNALLVTSTGRTQIDTSEIALRMRNPSGGFGHMQISTYGSTDDATGSLNYNAISDSNGNSLGFRGTGAFARFIKWTGAAFTNTKFGINTGDSTPVASLDVRSLDTTLACFIKGGPSGNVLQVDTNTINNAFAIASDGDWTGSFSTTGNVTLSPTGARDFFCAISNTNSASRQRFYLDADGGQRLQMLAFGSTYVGNDASYQGKNILQSSEAILRISAQGATAALRRIEFITDNNALSAPVVHAEMDENGAWAFGSGVTQRTGYPITVNNLNATNVITIDERVGDAGALADAGVLYTKDVVGVTELFYRKSDGTVVQLS